MIAYPHAEKNLLLIQIKFDCLYYFYIIYILNGQVSGNLTWTNAPLCIIFKNQLLERHPFSGRCDSAGELLHTPYADSNFHGHRPAVGTTRNTLSVYRKVGADNVRPGLSWERQVESLIASSAYQKWPTTNLWYNKYLRKKKINFYILPSEVLRKVSF
jgi:hypothetical protein